MYNYFVNFPNFARVNQINSKKLQENVVIPLWLRHIDVITNETN